MMAHGSNPRLERLRQEDHEIKVSLGYTQIKIKTPNKE